MTQEFEGAALDGIDRSYRSGPPGEQQLLLDDGHVSQVLPIEAPARRSLQPLGDLGGMFHGVFQNDHPIAGALESFINPYEPVNFQGEYPAPISLAFDVWLLSISVSADVGDGALVTSAGIFYTLESVSQMFSDTAAGGGITPTNRRILIQGYTDFTSLAGLDTAEDFGVDLAGRAFEPMAMRVPRGPTFILFRSLVTGATVMTATALFGIFPSALGADLKS